MSILFWDYFKILFLLFAAIYDIIKTKMERNHMNDLAKKVDECIQKRGVKKTWIAEQLGISQQLLNKRLNKKNFTIEDANEILETIGYKTDYTIIPMTTIQKEMDIKTSDPRPELKNPIIFFDDKNTEK